MIYVNSLNEIIVKTLISTFEPDRISFFNDNIRLKYLKQPYVSYKFVKQTMYEWPREF